MFDPVGKALQLLNGHYEAFAAAKPLADETGHTVPSDTKSWSQILVSVLTDIKGRFREKGSDLADGSDVKGANVWTAIDTPRFNGVIPAGRVSTTSMKPPDVSALDGTPYIFFVMWDEKGIEKYPRCRVWVVNSQEDEHFRLISSKWYQWREEGKIKSDNFQLHPPRNLDTNIFRNTCGNLSYPLLFSAVKMGDEFELESYDPSVLTTGRCTPVV